jgi:hypothetical protein
MRISKLIELLQQVQKDNGDIQIVARNRDGDSGTPKVEMTTWYRGKRWIQQWEVTTERSER